MEEQTLLFAAGETPECGLSKSVDVINAHLTNYGELKAVHVPRLPNLALYGLHHQIGCELGIRFIIKIIHEAELWQKRTLPPLSLEAASVISQATNQGELAGMTLVLKRNGEPMVFFSEQHELDMAMSTLEAQSRMMTLREGAQILRGHFLLS
ncbi:hypothetical protein PALB_15470 [Pseudoalteromonas luteoviolacea B = ATCC 29581]|nr:hypothetical protein PALB_15470 [Pseudoalteromonas luteoviolacea B = ATCC 29581]